MLLLCAHHYGRSAGGVKLNKTRFLLSRRTVDATWLSSGLSYPNFPCLPTNYIIHDHTLAISQLHFTLLFKIHM